MSDKSEWTGESITLDTSFYLDLLKDQEKLQALEEENKVLREAVESASVLTCVCSEIRRDGDIVASKKCIGCKSKQALEKVGGKE